MVLNRAVLYIEKMSGQQQAKYEDNQESALQWEVQGIRMGHNHSKFVDYGTFSASNDSEYVRLHLGLRGDYRFTYQQLGQSFDLAGGHHNIMYSKGIDLEVSNKTLEIDTFGVNFPPALFLRFTQDADDMVQAFAEAVLSGKSQLFTPRWGTVDAKIQRVIDEIMASPYEGAMMEVFLYAKSLELLVLCMDNYKTRQQQEQRFLKTRADQERIIAARDYINARLSDPPHLAEVAQAVGLNEFKLKHGFKETFQSTVFAYLTDRRLQRARQYLLDTDKTAAEIAHLMGYSSPQHFSQQFRAKFGMTPKSIRTTP